MCEGWRALELEACKLILGNPPSTTWKYPNTYPFLSPDIPVHIFGGADSGPTLAGEVLWKTKVDAMFARLWGYGEFVKAARSTATW